jgi:hypothetical protein
MFEGVMHGVEPEMLGTTRIGAVEEGAVMAGFVFCHASSQAYRPIERVGVNMPKAGCVIGQA